MEMLARRRSVAALDRRASDCRITRMDSKQVSRPAEEKAKLVTDHLPLPSSSSLPKMMLKPSTSGLRPSKAATVATTPSPGSRA